MKARRETLESRKAEYEERLRGLRAYARELKETAARHGTDGEHSEDDLTRAAHDAEFYESELHRVGGEPEGATDALTYCVFKEAAGERRRHLRSSNNRIIADSAQGYRHRDDCLGGVELVKNSADAPVEDKQ